MGSIWVVSRMWQSSFVLIAAVVCVVEATDVLIVGGSLSSLAAAITVANASLARREGLNISLLEPTDWLGGQLTSSNVPPDFGQFNNDEKYLPNSFVQLLLKVGSVNETWATNPGNCWVSEKCFEVQNTARYINDWLKQSFPNLRVYYNTVVKAAGVDPKTGKVVNVTAIQRTSKHSVSANHPYPGYDKPLSMQLSDWYSSNESEEFGKQILFFDKFKVVIEASEFGDLLINAAASLAQQQSSLRPADIVVQGYETPSEESDTWVSDCGQSATISFTMGRGAVKNENADARFPTGSAGNIPFSLDNTPFRRVWSYRRVATSATISDDEDSERDIPVGEQSNQNWAGGNDYTAGYVFLSHEETMKQALSKQGWQGGINVKVLEAMEQRAYGWYHYYKAKADDPTRSHLFLNLSQVATGTGLSKMPYLRESRRSRQGIKHFKLTFKRGLNVSSPSEATSRPYADSIALGDYLYCDIHALSVETGACFGQDAYPDYLLQDYPLVPYYIPFRAITNAALPNVLTPGKSMAQSFLANAGTRLHPTEWSTGVAAGAAAVLMAGKRDFASTNEVYDQIEELQSLLRSDCVLSPLEWNL